MPYDQVPGRYLDLYRDAAIDALCRRPDIPAAGTRWGDYYRQSIRGYYAMTTGVDEQFGRILDALEAAGQTENTIVVFTSDHGNCLGIHDEISKNNYFEESVRIPLLIRWPGRIRARRDEALVSVPDMMPSLLGLMGYAADIPAGVEGTNFDRLIRTGEGTRPSSQLYFRIPPAKTEPALRGVRTGRHTLVVERGGGGRERTVLYDNSKDPYQLRDAASESPAIVRRLIEEELKPWLKRTADPFFR
jgi:N-acetylglucosamine-6-sulfatase